MDTAGYLASIIVGLLLGLVGGGGSILIVPILVYLFRVDAMLATTYSLFIVAITSTAGAATYFKKGLIHFRTAFLFGIPSIGAILLTRAFVVPSIPETIFEVGNFILTRDILLMLLFATLMIVASVSMLKRDSAAEAPATPQNASISSFLLQGVGTGIVTGLIGAGGGFLIIPALVKFLGLSMKTAVGTSLFIIAINSLAGFFLSGNEQDIHWDLLLRVSAIAIGGVVAGSLLSFKIDGRKLQPAFGWFVLVMGVFIIIKEIVLK